MKYMKRIFFLLLLILIYSKLFSKESFVIPFQINSEGNIFIELLDEYDNYSFMFDTASTPNVLYKKGYEKIKNKYGFNIEDKLYEMVIEKNPTVSEDAARKYVKEYIDQNTLIFEVKNLRYEKEKFATKKFIYNHQVYRDFDDSEFDGIVGLSFFDDLKNLTINYKENLIIINDTKKLEKSIQLEKLKQNNIFKIEISINNVIQEAIIDTGSMYFFVRPEYENTKRYSEQELLNAIDINNLKQKIGKSEINVQLKIGDFSSIVKGYFFDKQKYKCTEAGESFAYKINILGNQLFLNHIIQLDFENMEFRIE